MMKTLFLLLLLLWLGALVLAFPLDPASTQFLLLLAVGIAGVILWMIYVRARQIIAWIFGEPVPGGQVGQALWGAHQWIQGCTFSKGPDASKQDPDPNKPIVPPPTDF